MFKILLISKLLRRRLAPMFAILAVTLCTAMVIIVNSVMGGFLTSMREAGKTLSGDVWVNGGMDGFPYYRELIAKLEKDPAIEAATPVLKATGLIQNNRKSPKLVEIEGIEPEGMDRVTGIKSRFYWTSKAMIQEYEKDLANPNLSPGFKEMIQAKVDALKAKDIRELAMGFKGPESWGNVPGIVPGIALFSRRDSQGAYRPEQSLTANAEANLLTVTVLPITNSGAIRTPELRQFMAVNEVKSGLYELDAKKAYLPLATVQEMLKMNPAPQVNAEGELTGKMTEPRVTNIVIKGRPGHALAEVEKATLKVVTEFQAAHPNNMALMQLNVITWEVIFSRLLGAVENEKGMMTFLFAIISMVAVMMVGTLFYMIVQEKTRDIGVLRAIGASGFGIMWVFVGFGLTIGLVGAGLGFGLSALVVNHLNDIQYFLATYLGVTAFLALGTLAGGAIGISIGLGIGLWRDRLEKPMVIGTLAGLGIGLVGPLVALLTASELAGYLNENYKFLMWNPQVYYFDRIPARLDMNEVWVILGVAVVASVVGALIPSVIAARVNPVESLRYE